MWPTPIRQLSPTILRQRRCREDLLQLINTMLIGYMKTIVHVEMMLSKLEEDSMIFKNVDLIGEFRGKYKYDLSEVYQCFHHPIVVSLGGLIEESRYDELYVKIYLVRKKVLWKLYVEPSCCNLL